MFDEIFEQWVALSPMYQTRLGRTTNLHLLDDISPEASAARQELYREQLAQLKALATDPLSDANRLNLRLLTRDLELQIEHYRWRDHSYPVNQMFGLHSGIAAFMINAHPLNSAADAEAYIARLSAIGPLFDQLIANLERRADKGILAPAFVYPYTINDCRNLISGYPFAEKNSKSDSNSESGLAASPLWQHFETTLGQLDLDDSRREALLEDARLALISVVGPAYSKLIATLKELSLRADDRAGAWKLPDGEAFYQAQLQATTTTTYTAAEIHQIGLVEVARIHKELETSAAALGFKAGLPAFFQHLQTNQDFYYPNTQEGRDNYLNDTRKIIDAIRSRLPELFHRLPQASLEVRPVEAFREKSAAKAFYMSPAVDGSRPGIYYVNLHDLSAMPKYEMQALAYHEALPGHHMQIAIAQELDDVPQFRRHGGYTAYIEGWGLYAEQVPVALGLYEDPYANVGRLNYELWRAIRLVVDTGLHYKRWSREQAIAYMTDNSPMTQSDATREIERYIVMPAQATAYKIGLLEILRLKNRAVEQLGEGFDLAEFHDQVLAHGALPLDVLDERLAEWQNSAQAVTE